MSRRLPSLAILAGFAAIYLFWGGTFLAIKIGDQFLPPLLLAALRFLAAGVLLYFWGWARGWKHPNAREWWSVAAVALIMFPAGYGIQFWAQTRVPSGVTAVLLSLVPLWIAAIEAWLLRTAPASPKVLSGCVLGGAGIAVLMSGGGHRLRLPLGPMLALLGAAVAWAVATLLIGRLKMPASAGMSAAAQMLVGGLMLAAGAGVTGEFRGLDWAAAFTPAVLWALVYLVLAGSVIAYGAFVWLLGRVSAVEVATYALVNPVVALLLGWGWGGEALTASSLAGSAIVLAALALVLSRAQPAAVMAPATTQVE